MILGKHVRYCPNCGKMLYDHNLSMNHILSQMCSKDCRTIWDVKYAKSILGYSQYADGEEPPETKEAEGNIDNE